jgi:hypothetical protein
MGIGASLFVGELILKSKAYFSFFSTAMILSMFFYLRVFGDGVYFSFGCSI